MRGTATWRMQFSIWLILSEIFTETSTFERTQMTMHQPGLRIQEREQLVQAYSRLIREKMDEGRDAYFVNLMFNQLPGSSLTRTEIMTQEVGRVHSILMHHIVRRPQAEKWAHLRPIFIGSHDLPVFKWDRRQLHRLDVVNDGLHFNVVALVPPPNPRIFPDWVQFQMWGPLSRQKVPLNQHFHQKSKFYLNDRLARIHATPVTRGTMADYTLKAFKNGRMDSDSVLVLK